MGYMQQMTKEEENTLIEYNDLIPSKFIVNNKEVLVIRCNLENGFLSYFEDEWEHSLHFTHFKPVDNETCSSKN